MKNRMQHITFTAAILLSMNWIKTVIADTPPHTNWAKLAFRTATDVSPTPRSAFIAALDLKTFSNVTAIQELILNKCTKLATTAVDAWDNSSIDFKSLKLIPGGAYRTQAQLYTTFANYNFGHIDFDAVECIKANLKPFCHTTPIIDWKVGYIVLFSLAMVTAAACLTTAAVCCYRKHSANGQGLFQPLLNETNLEAAYGADGSTDRGNLNRIINNEEPGSGSSSPPPPYQEAISMPQN